MKRFLTILSILIPVLAFAQTTEDENYASYGYASDSYNERTDTVVPIRYISGGTVFIVNYSEECDFEMKVLLTMLAKSSKNICRAVRLLLYPFHGVLLEAQQRMRSPKLMQKAVMT